MRANPTTTRPSTSPSARSRGRGRTWAALVIAATAIVVVVGVVVAALMHTSRAVPAFPYLTKTPDATLQGTVAYFADVTSCVKVVAASGQASRNVLCLPAQDPSEAEKLGKLVGPQLVWRPDGRLEVTMFRLTNPPGPSFRPGWQKVIDVRTRAVHDTPLAQLPSQPNLGTQPTVSPDGRRIATTSDDDGRVEIVLHEGDRSRVLLSAHGPGEGTYHMTAFWAPDGHWIAADDGRILVVTPTDPPVVRVLTDESTQGGYGGYPRFAVTSRNLLTGTS